MDALINKVLDMGWRVVEGVLTPPAGDRCPQRHRSVSILVPVDLESWIKTREAVLNPQIATHEREIKSIFHEQWPFYLDQCGGDEGDATYLLLADVCHDKQLEEDDAKDWLEEVKSAR